MRTHTAHTRDAALRQLRRANRWMIAGSVALTGVLAGVAANGFPGKTIKGSPASKSGSKGHPRRSSRTPAKPLKPPARAPQASSESPASQESSDTPQSAPQESAPSRETRQSAPTQQAAPPQQTQQSAPAAPETSREAAPEAPAPVVSGGS